ncbi:MAG: NAD(P)/FAD-dependent oxidoreductase [Alphaproteobacteria bacterium]
MSYPQTYYSERLQPKPESQPILSGAVDADICIVGGGLAGLTLALRLAEQGQSCLLLEAEQVGFGASGRNGGFVSPGFAQSVDVLEKKLGLDTAQTLFAETVRGAEFVRKRAKAMGGVIQGDGQLKLLRYNAPDALQRIVHHMNAVHDQRLEVLSPDALAAQLSSKTYRHAIHDPHTFTIDPLAYVQGLKQQVLATGLVNLCEKTPAASLQKQGASWQITTAQGSVKARNVVLTGSAYLGQLYRPLAGAVLPIATYVVSTHGLGSSLDEAIRFRGAIADTRLAGDYYRRIEGDQLLWGGRITTQRSEPRFLANLLKQQIVEIYPQLSDLRIRHAWSGLMGYAVHKMPIIGELEPGLWSCTAFGGYGLSTTAMGAHIVADALLQGDDRWRMFQPFGARWSGGVFGRAGTQLVYWGMQLKDRWQEKSGR